MKQFYSYRKTESLLGRTRMIENNILTVNKLLLMKLMKEIGEKLASRVTLKIQRFKMLLKV